MNDLADTASIFFAIRYAGMLRPRRMESQKVAILRKQNAIARKAVGELIFILGIHETRLRRRADINSTTAETGGHSQMAILIEMKSNCPRHRSLASEPRRL